MNITTQNQLFELINIARRWNYIASPSATPFAATKLDPTCDPKLVQAFRVICDGHQRLARGRRVTMMFGECRNPRKAFEQALKYLEPLHVNTYKPSQTDCRKVRLSDVGLSAANVIAAIRELDEVYRNPANISADGVALKKHVLDKLDLVKIVEVIKASTAYVFEDPSEVQLAMKCLIRESIARGRRSPFLYTMNNADILAAKEVVLYFNQLFHVTPEKVTALLSEFKKDFPGKKLSVLPPRPFVEKPLAGYVGADGVLLLIGRV